MMKTYLVYKFDKDSVILRNAITYKVVVEKGSDTALYWNPFTRSWSRSIYSADQLARLATFVGERKMQLK